MIKNIHHINFLVRELEPAIIKYQALLGGEAKFIQDELSQRAVKTARTKLGETWLILVQPLDKNSVPGKHLTEHGEGFFLLSLESSNLTQEKQRLESEGFKFAGKERQGLDQWRVQDLQAKEFFGAQIQLVED